MIKSGAFAVCLVAAGVLAAPAYAQSVGEKTGVNATLGITPSTPDFVTEAAKSDMLEIQSSQLADQKADGANKSFAQKMVTDHTATSAELKPWCQPARSAVELPTDCGHAAAHARQAEQPERRGLHQAISHDQLSAHKDAVSLFERYAKGGDNATLQEFAAKTLPHLREHLKMAEDLDK